MIPHYPSELTEKIKLLAEQLKESPDAFLAIIHVVHAMARELRSHSGPDEREWDSACGKIAIEFLRLTSSAGSDFSEGYLRASGHLQAMLEQMSYLELGLPVLEQPSSETPPAVDDDAFFRS